MPASISFWRFTSEGRVKDLGINLGRVPTEFLVFGEGDRHAERIARPGDFFNNGSSSSARVRAGRARPAPSRVLPDAGGNAGALALAKYGYGQRRKTP